MFGLIPAATARRFARTPEAMAGGAVVLGCIAVVLGLWGSFTWAVPSGPAIVVAAFLIFALFLLLPQRRLSAPR